MLPRKIKTSPFSKRWKSAIIFIVFNFITIHSAPVAENKDPPPEIKHSFLDAPPGVYSQNTIRHDQDKIQQDIIPLPLNLDELAEVLRDEDPVAVYLKYNFTQDGLWDENSATNVAYLESEEYLSYIDPLSFMVVSPGLGYLLLSLPFDYIPLSLSSLGMKVATVTMDMSDMPNTVDFTRLDDNDQLQVMYDLAQEIIVAATLMNSESSPETSAIVLTKFAVCTHKLDVRRAGYMYIRRFVAAIMNNRYQLLQSVYDCRQYGPLDDVQIPDQYWFNRYLPLLFAFLVFCFAPLALAFFFRNNPPFEDENGTTRITTLSDLPIGFKYTFMFSCDNEWTRGLKVTVGLLSLVFLSYLQPMVAYLSNKEDYNYRVQAAERMDSVGFWVFVGVKAGYYLLFLAMFLAYVFNILLSDQVGVRWESESDRKKLTFMKLPRELWVSKVDLPFTQSTIYFARKRMLMALDARLWKHEFQRLWDWIKSRPNCKTWCIYTFGIFAYLILLIPYGLVFFIRLFFNSLPSFYITKQCLTDYKCKIPIGAITIVLAALRVPAIVWYIITLFQCTFVGLVVNHQVVLPPLIIVSAILYFGVKIYNEIYQDYVDLTRNIISEVVTAREKNVKHEEEHSSHSFSKDTHAPKFYIVENGMPAIELDLWYFIINDIRSISNRFFVNFITFMLASTILAIEFQFLWFINEQYDLSDLMFPFATILLALSLPLLFRMLTPADAMSERKRREDVVRIKTLITKYFNKHQSYDSNDDFGKI